MLVFKERRKPEYPEKNLAEQGRDPTTNLSHICLRRQDSNSGHICGRRVLSPLRYPCSPVYFRRGILWAFIGLPSFRRSRRENSYSRPLPKCATKARHLSFTFGTFISIVYCYHPPLPLSPLFLFCVFVSAKQRRDSWFRTLKVPMKEQPEFFEKWIRNCPLLS